MIHTSVSYTFTLTLDKSSISTPISTRFKLLQGSATRADQLMRWRIKWRPDPPRLVRVEELDQERFEASTTRSRCASVPDRGTVCATISVEHAAAGPQDELSPSKPIAHGYGTWVYEGTKTDKCDIDRCKVECEEMAKIVTESELSSVEFVATLQIGEDERPTHFANNRVITEHRVMSKTIDSLRIQYRDTRLQQHSHDVRFVFTPSGRTLYANSKILCSRSSYYQDIFTSGFRESQKTSVANINPPHQEHANSTPCTEGLHTLHIDENCSDTFETYATALTWIHTDRIKFASDDPPKNHPTPESIYRLADQLLLDDLRSQASDAFQASFTPSNAVKSLFSTFSRDFPPIHHLCIGVCVTHWSSQMLEEVKSFIAQGDRLEIGAIEAMDVMAALSARLFESLRRTPN